MSKLPRANPAGFVHVARLPARGGLQARNGLPSKEASTIGDDPRESIVREEMAMTGAEVYGDCLRWCMCAKHGKLKTRLIRTMKSRHRHPSQPRISPLVSGKIFVL